jgi:hypothetical protein
MLAARTGRDRAVTAPKELWASHYTVISRRYIRAALPAEARTTVTLRNFPSASTNGDDGRRDHDDVEFHFVNRT